MIFLQKIDTQGIKNVALSQLQNQPKTPSTFQKSPQITLKTHQMAYFGDKYDSYIPKFINTLLIEYI